MKLKDTLNLGKTEFPMRAGLPTKEPVWQKEWEDAKLYQRRQELNQGKPHFTLHDGPPYANGNIHVGHAMNKISKDIIVRSKSMSGFYAPYIPDKRPCSTCWPWCPPIFWRSTFSYRRCSSQCRK